MAKHHYYLKVGFYVDEGFNEDSEDSNLFEDMDSNVSAGEVHSLDVLPNEVARLIVSHSADWVDLFVVCFGLHFSFTKNK